MRRSMGMAAGGRRRGSAELMSTVRMSRNRGGGGGVKIIQNVLRMLPMSIYHCYFKYDLFLRLLCVCIVSEAARRNTV